MKDDLNRFLRAELARPPSEAIKAAGFTLARQFEGTQSVLFYGSLLRTGELDGVADFYVLTRRPPPGARGLLSRSLWPDVSYREIDTDAGRVRAKVAAMTISQFERAARGDGADTTIWTRFVQPAALVWREGAISATRTVAAVAEAVKTAGRFAAALGPKAGPPNAYWEALFRQTYAAELRFEKAGRGQTILAFNPDRYELLLPLAWRASGLAFEATPGGVVEPQITARGRAGLKWSWGVRRTLGRPLNVARLAKAAFTFEGATRYAAWKIERHTGVAIPVTPWRERHPLMAAPLAAWTLWRARRAVSRRQG